MRWIFVLIALASTPAWGDCEHFKWPLARERAWFAAAPEPLAAGAEIDPGEQAYALTLKPGEAAAYVLPPKKPVAGTFGGVVRLRAIPKGGLYQVTLSREAWIDLIQNGVSTRSRNVSRQSDCAEIHKSVRFQLEAGPAILQISGVDASAIAFAVAPSP
jgi:hypothetical protein